MNTAGGRYHLVTFGCQMNKYDSEKIEGLLARQGMTPTDDPAQADLVLLNTCSIREKAESKVFSKLGRLAATKREGQLIALGGCMASLRKEDLFRRAPMVDLLFGPDAIARIPALIEQCRATGQKQADVAFADAAAWDRPEDGAIRESRTVAWVGIMKGCDNHCAYCVVPATRGPEVSRPMGSILEEVAALAAKGFKEINLLGQNVNSYGKGLSPAVSFPQLLRKVNGVPGVERIRFMTSHPKDLNDELIAAVAECEKVCPSFHLPLQAGGDRVLAMMKRGYTAAEYLDKVARLKRAVPHITLSTDIMVGFPTETEEEFLDTVRVMEEARFDSLFLFNYSPRPGTNAAGMEGSLPRELMQHRFDRALQLHKKLVRHKYDALIGTSFPVLCEGEADSGGGRMYGRTPGNHLVLFIGDAALEGRTVPVTITSYMGYNLIGVIA